MNAWLRTHDGGVTVTVHVQPGAKKTEVAGVHGDALKIRLAAPPVDGKANAALIDYLAKKLDVRKSCITLKSGESSRHKILAIEGVDPELISDLL